MKNWRPENWEELARWTDPTGKGHPDRGYFEAGADALWEALMKYRVKMPPDFKPILIVIPSEE